MINNQDDILGSLFTEVEAPIEPQSFDPLTECVFRYSFDSVAVKIQDEQGNARTLESVLPTVREQLQIVGSNEGNLNVKLTDRYVAGSEELQAGFVYTILERLSDKG